jgi:hypothetical protein
VYWRLLHSPPRTRFSFSIFSRCLRPGPSHQARCPRTQRQHLR